MKRLLDDIIEDRVGRLIISHKDRLLRFGEELVFAICDGQKGYGGTAPCYVPAR